MKALPFLLLLPLVVACKQSDAPTTTGEAPRDVQPSSSFKWVPVRPSSDAPPEEYPARLLSSAGTVAVSVAPLPARIISLAVKPGDDVEKGGAIATVVMPEADAAIATLRAAETSLGVLTKRRAQLGGLESEGLVKASDLAALDLDIARLKGEKVRAEAVLQGAGLKAGGTVTLRSPVAGVVTEVAAIQGELRRPEDGPIARIRSRTGQRIEAMFPERPPTDATFSFRLGTEPLVPVKLVNVVPQSPGVGFVAWFDTQGDISLGAGTEGRIAVSASASADAYLVPSSAVGSRGAQRFVVARTRTDVKSAELPVQVLRVTSSDSIVRGALSESSLVATEPYRAGSELAGEKRP
ncbi:MAG TPA: hypothetical protein VFQ35_00850 [Polyangiaceae bacterium]|nr:hypothetical protein [Polyangiaceae bacterium]